MTTRHGIRMRGNTTDLVQSNIYFFGQWEPNITASLRRTLEEDDVFIDVGANIGYYSLLAAQLVGPAGGVLAINAAVLDRSRTVTVHHGPDHNVGSTSVVSPATGSWTEATVPGEPL